MWAFIQVLFNFNKIPGQFDFRSTPCCDLEVIFVIWPLKTIGNNVFCIGNSSVMRVLHLEKQVHSTGAIKGNILANCSFCVHLHLLVSCDFFCVWRKCCSTLFPSNTRPLPLATHKNRQEAINGSSRKIRFKRYSEGTKIVWIGACKPRITQLSGVLASLKRERLLFWYNLSFPLSPKKKEKKGAQFLTLAKVWFAKHLSVKQSACNATWLAGSHRVDCRWRITCNL